MKPAQIVDAIASLSFENAFNPYTHRCEVHDRREAPGLRRAALLAILEVACIAGVEALWIGRDLGYRGGRRTGLALTDDVHMAAHARRWKIEMARPTDGEVVAERTAAVVWGILGLVQVPVFLWNVFPLHPHEPGKPFSNRAHTALERRAGEEILAILVEALGPERIVAIGNDAAAAASHVTSKVPVIKVRHPSYGGHNEFLASMRALYDLSAPEELQLRLI